VNDSLSRMTNPPRERDGPTFDLIVATVGRTGELDALLASLERQTHRGFRVIVVDQNEDERLKPVLLAHSDLDVQRLRSRPGLSRARNVALPHVEADLVAFPDDDCAYPDDLLARVARRFAERNDLDILTGRAEDRDGRSSASWPTDAARLTPSTVWNRANSHTIFIRRPTLERTGTFDESLGLGSGTRWHAGEEIDLLVRALLTGARAEYDPTFVVLHPRRQASAGDLRALGARDGASVGYILGRNRLPARIVGRMLIRPLGGVAAAALRGNLARARFHAATLGGRIRGYVAGRRADRHA
jgi:GT2 family glycosyltransferase